MQETTYYAHPPCGSSSITRHFATAEPIHVNFKNSNPTGKATFHHSQQQEPPSVQRELQYALKHSRNHHHSYMTHLDESFQSLPKRMTRSKSNSSFHSSFHYSSVSKTMNQNTQPLSGTSSSLEPPHHYTSPPSSNYTSNLLMKANYSLSAPTTTIMNHSTMTRHGISRLTKFGFRSEMEFTPYKIRFHEGQHLYNNSNNNNNRPTTTSQNVNGANSNIEHGLQPSVNTHVQRSSSCRPIPSSQPAISTATRNYLPSIGEILRNIEEHDISNTTSQKTQHHTREVNNNPIIQSPNNEPFQSFMNPSHSLLLGSQQAMIHSSSTAASQKRQEPLNSLTTLQRVPLLQSSPPSLSTSFNSSSPSYSGVVVCNNRDRSNSVSSYSSSVLTSSVQSASSSSFTTSSQTSNKKKETNSDDSTLYKSAKISKSNTSMLKKNKRYLSDRAVKLLKEWLFMNWDNPYPDSNQKRELAKMADISVSQVNNYFINARRRICKKFESPPEDCFN
ncbi:hypothetical protein FDP41_007855 [Naegleria fowleri]|uniref:Homeobox domain-containing protein n=1 Tax=Naegleria fowleri TaxID=5763 RepID=A0A6A5CEC7_NAEFO|nr:uncharacterized protein FDP41_007855 [Naegleria fowleri]KAF0983940.1 hypothetical protein FDP41_007855 [Naegleria fowleri]